MKKEHKYWIEVLEKLSMISGQSVPDMLNDYWECETDCLSGKKPFIDVKNTK